MLTDECEMRPFLENRGIEIVETDLGERIQQLDDEPPSHIVCRRCTSCAATSPRYSAARSAPIPTTATCRTSPRASAGTRGRTT
jgi:Uncharacterized conserved protein containing a ferredoxin-like domain